MLNLKITILIKLCISKLYMQCLLNVLYRLIVPTYIHTKCSVKIYYSNYLKLGIHWNQEQIQEGKETYDPLNKKKKIKKTNTHNIS